MRACPQHRERTLGRSAGDLLGVDLVEDLEAHSAPRCLGARLHPRVADRDAVDAEARTHPVVLDEQAVGVGDEHPTPGVGVRGAHLADRVAHRSSRVVGPFEHLGLAGLGHRLREHRDRVRGPALPAFERGDVRRPGGALSGGGGGVGGGPETALAEVGGVGEAGRLAAYDPDPRTPLAPGHELLHLGVVETCGCQAPIFGEHLGEVAAVAQRGLERPLEYRCFDQVASCRGCLS